jgi:hypothetical protein
MADFELVGSPDVPVDPDEYRRQFARVLDQQAEREREPAALDTSERRQTNPNGQRLSSLVGRLTRSAARAGTRALDETSNTVVSIGAGIADRTGLGRAVHGDDWTLWYSQRTGDVNPLQFGDERRQRLWGEEETGVLGFVETAMQFTAGMVGFGKALKAAGLAHATGRRIASGALTDVAAFDPYLNRLSNLV